MTLQVSQSWGDSTPVGRLWGESRETLSGFDPGGFATGECRAWLTGKRKEINVSYRQMIM